MRQSTTTMSYLLLTKILALNSIVASAESSVPFRSQIALVPSTTSTQIEIAKIDISRVV
ncbi:hypothetical protein CA13_02000 [Planctomycetes bacterium CA13]|uniref:Uncharacterized protein n=1 Tax=Novipirellula herctigrandis TaxID=2527986 RepID=A0A5C5YVZ0_9BACT|nr:hypothetical protein CA13_02000 [Planctomycetes bacterium CA13]